LLRVGQNFCNRVFEIFGDLRTSLRFVFCLLHGVLIPEFGDLILRVCSWLKTQHSEKVPNYESLGGTPLPRFVEGRDVFLFESRGTVARRFAKFKESCAVEAVIPGAVVPFWETS
jgi:hypothetical protein